VVPVKRDRLDNWLPTEPATCPLCGYVTELVSRGRYETLASHHIAEQHIFQHEQNGLYYWMCPLCRTAEGYWEMRSQATVELELHHIETVHRTPVTRS